MTEMKKHRNLRHKMTKVIKSTIYTFCLIGCSYHLILCSHEYFKYLTKASLATYIPFDQTMPYTSLCIPRKGNISTEITEPCKDFAINQSNIVNNCARRNFNTRRLEKSKCSRDFIVTQSLRRSNSYICYTIRVKKYREYDILEAIALRVDRRKLYTFSLAQTFEEQRQMLLLIHFDSYPHSEYQFSSESHFSQASKNISLAMSYKVFEAYSLPSPYETNCVERLICVDSCGRRYNWCKNAFCSQNVTITYIRRVGTSRPGIHVDVETVSSPTTKVEYIPREELTAFILQVCSLLGIWLSVSVHLIASTVIRHLRKRPRERRVHLNPFHWRRQIINLSRRSGVDIRKIGSFLMLNPPDSRQVDKSSNRCVRLVAKMAIILLFLRELTLISVDYFEYAILYEGGMKIDAGIGYPDISYCIDIATWFNVSRGNPRFESFDREMTAESNALNLTLKQIFGATPEESSVIKKCTVRTGDSNLLTESNDCNQYFDTKKFYYGEFICYLMKPLFKITPLTKIEGNSSTLYSIVPRDDLAKVSHYQAIVSNGLPEISRYLVSESWRQSQHEALELDFKIVKYSLLPHPFSTGCSSYLTQSITDCRETCWDYSKWKRVPFSNLIDRPIDLPIVDYIDMKNESFINAYERAEVFCETVCGLPCDESFTNTYHEIDETDELLELTMSYPKYPVNQFIAVPRFTVYQYVYQVFCSASFWIGFSIINCLCLICCLKTNNRITPIITQSDALAKIHHLEKQNKITGVRKPVKRKLSIKMNFKGRMVCILYSGSLFIGFCVHCFIVAAEFFTYPTVMNSWVSFEENFTDLRTLVCISLDQLKLDDRFSVQDIWAKSPAPDQLIKECGYRGIDLPQLSSLPKKLRKRLFPFVNSSSICQSIFEVEKFISLGLVCYNIKPVRKVLDTEYRMQYQISLTRIYGYVIISSVFSRFNLTVAVSQGPFANSLIMPTTLSHTHSGQVNQYYFISYVKFFISSLPYPYQMGVYDSLKKITCMRNCVSNRLLGKQFFSSYSEIESPSTLLYETYSQDTLKDSMRTRRGCEARCRISKRYNQQSDVVFDSFNDGPYNSVEFVHLKGTIGLWLSTSGQVVTKTSFLPEFRFVDLVLYVGSIFAIWFGCSASQLIDMATSHNRRRSNRRKNILNRRNESDIIIRKRDVNDLQATDYFAGQWSYIRTETKGNLRMTHTHCSRRRGNEGSSESNWKQKPQAVHRECQN